MQQISRLKPRVPTKGWASIGIWDINKPISKFRRGYSIDYKYLRNNLTQILENAKARNVLECDPALVVQLHDLYRTHAKRVNELRQELNTVSKGIQQASREKNQTCIEEIKVRAQEIKRDIKVTEDQMRQIEYDMEEQAKLIPNITDPTTPAGKDDSDATVVEQIIKTEKSFTESLVDQQEITSKIESKDINRDGNKDSTRIEPHKYRDNAELCTLLQIADFNRAAKVSGSKFHYLINEGAILEQALIQYSLQLAVKDFGFRFYSSIPELVKEKYIEGCGFNTKKSEESIEKYRKKMGKLRSKYGICTENADDIGEIESGGDSYGDSTGAEPSQIYRVVGSVVGGETSHQDAIKESSSENNKEHGAGDDLCLIATAEIPLTAYYSGEILQVGKHKVNLNGEPGVTGNSIDDGVEYFKRGKEFKQVIGVTSTNTNTSAGAGAGLGVATELGKLPLGLVGLSHSFRTEAGSRGKETKGLYRLHQFTKLELVILTPPTISISVAAAQESSHSNLKEEQGYVMNDASKAALDYLVSFQRTLFTNLDLNIRILDMPTGELGNSAYKKYDIEAYLPGLKKWGEVSSASNCTDYQARRLEIRYKSHNTLIDNKGKGGKGGKGGTSVEYVHTLNATACAVQRTIAAILETHQDPQTGVVDVPKVLWPWMMGIHKIYPKTK